MICGPVTRSGQTGDAGGAVVALKIAPPCEIHWYRVGGIIAPINLCPPTPRVDDFDIALL